MIRVHRRKSTLQSLRPTRPSTIRVLVRPGRLLVDACPGFVEACAILRKGSRSVSERSRSFSERSRSFSTVPAPSRPFPVVVGVLPCLSGRSPSLSGRSPSSLPLFHDCVARDRRRVGPYGVVLPLTAAAFTIPDTAFNVSLTAASQTNGELAATAAASYLTGATRQLTRSALLVTRTASDSTGRCGSRSELRWSLP